MEINIVLNLIKGKVTNIAKIQTLNFDKMEISIILVRSFYNIIHMLID